MRIAFTAMVLAALTAAVHAQTVDQQIANDPIAQACKVLADKGNDTAREYYQDIKAQLRATARTQAEGAPEGESVQDFQHVMRQAAVARGWCGAIPIQTSPKAKAQSDDDDIPKEWVRQAMLKTYRARQCDKVLAGKDGDKDHEACERMRHQLDEWADYYE